MYKFKEKFLEKYSKFTDINRFCEYCVKPLNKSIRVNTLKISVKELKEKLNNYNFRQVPWCKEGFWIKGPRTDLGNLPEHSLGYFYVQEAASMIPPVVLNPRENELILDLAAAPGSKTTQMAAMMNNKGIIVANDIKYDRLKALSINLQRCGILNTIITLRTNFKNIKFDKILLDAPCSGTGAIRKSLMTLKIWNNNMIRKLANDQKRLILNSFDSLNDDCVLVYSTCSVDPEENEEVIDFLLKNRDAKLEKIDLDIKKSPVILEYEEKNYNEEIKKCLRIWPQDNDTEGFFVAKIRK
ncbi:MAG: RNA methylase, NOL1/NOP2/sun family [archaeon GW2011_AR20]|nr:MAG: RNA methylase, NOL1/NOP2/sun family [archaeon GW2011_AR20]MBS3160832.1 RsmB/NOP family class I SAM-dependent RNA methyltransferase [Candidatus Woesearchaeota archaeon]